jgi:uncharacterized protein (TIGR02996 family)
MRTFALDDGRSGKYWHIDLQGTQIHLAQGQLGGQGRTETHSVKTEEQAQRWVARLIQEHLEKGYFETTPPPAGLPPAMGLRDALERAILEHPDDLASYAAYADWLSEQAAPADQARAELIRLQLAQETTPDPERQERIEQLIAQHQTTWIGPWLARANNDGPYYETQLPFPPPLPVRYVRGIPAEVVLAHLSLELAAQFVTCRSSWQVRKLFIGGLQRSGYEDSPDPVSLPNWLQHLRHRSPSVGIYEALYRWPGLAHLRTLQFGWTNNEDYGEICPFRSDLSGDRLHEWVAQMPLVEELFINAHAVDASALFQLRMPRLRRLHLYENGEYPLEVLAENTSLSHLTHLFLHPQVRSNEISLTLDGLRAIARSPHLVSLKNLRLRFTVFGDAGVRELIASGLLGRLQTLDLRHGRVSDAGAALLAESPQARGLTHLDLSHNELTSEGIARLQAAGIPSVAQYQHGSTAEFGETPTAEDLWQMPFLFEGDFE